jgi:hypothetical protein
MEFIIAVVSHIFNVFQWCLANINFVLFPETSQNETLRKSEKMFYWYFATICAVACFQVISQTRDFEQKLTKMCLSSDISQYSLVQGSHMEKHLVVCLLYTL